MTKNISQNKPRTYGKRQLQIIIIIWYILCNKYTFINIMNLE